jgi:hypothetical protein
MVSRNGDEFRTLNACQLDCCVYAPPQAEGSNAQKINIALVAYVSLDAELELDLRRIDVAGGKRAAADGRRAWLAVGIAGPVRQQVTLPVWLEPAQFAWVQIGQVIQVPRLGQV